MGLFTQRPEPMGSDSFVSHPTPAQRPSATVIAHGVRVDGDFTSQGDVVIEGEVQGKVNVSGMLTVGSQATLKADISAENVALAGTIVGNITVRAHLDVKSTANITGDIQTQTVSVESGATVDGHVSVGAKTRLPIVSVPESNGTEGSGKKRNEVKA